MARGISFIITGSAGPLRKAIKEASDSLAGMSKGATLAFGAAATATTLFARQAIQAAADDQKQQALLARQLQVSAGATKAQAAAVEEYIDATQRSVAVSDTELRTSLQSLVVATGDLTKSQDLLNVAMDTAAATGNSTSRVAEALSRGYAGNTRALASLSPELKKAIKDGASFSDVLGILRNNFQGAGKEAAGTMAGQLAILGNTIDEAKESIGAALLPTLQQLLPQLVNLANWVGQNSALLGTAAVVIGTFAAGMVIAKGALVAWRAIGVATTAVNAALATSFSAVQIATGVGLVTALAAIPVYLKMKSTFDGLTKSTNNYTGALGGAIVNQKQLNEYMGPVPSRNLAEFQKHYANYATTVANAGKNTGSTASKLKDFRDKISSAKDAIRSYVDGIRDAITGTVSLGNAFSEAQSSQADATDQLNAALADRKQAYEELNQAKVTNDVEAYNSALARVAATEKAVTDAQAVKPKTYMEVFQAQITAAKEFATNLKALIGAGLGGAGLQQILSLGPVAGNAVAKDLLAGVGGYTVGSLNADLASIAAAGTSVGMSIPGVAGALGAKVGGTENKYYIEVKAGVGDKVEVAKQVVEVLQAYEKRLGGIPIKVKG
jgi:hypothetical protein